MRWNVLALTIAVCGLPGCINTNEGDQGVYIDPCTTGFGDVLLCGRETGAADPNAVKQPGTPGGDQPNGPYTCDDACSQFQACGFFDSPDDFSQCVAECPSATTQAQLDCIRDAGCDIEALQICFGISG